MCIALLATALLAAAPPPAPQNQVVALNVGEQKVLSLGEIVKVAVGDPNVADIKPLDRDQLLVVGKGAGQTTLLIWTSKAGAAASLHELSVHVGAETGATLTQALRALLPGADLSVTLLNGKQVVQGRVLTLSELRRLKTLVKGEPDVVLMVSFDRAGVARVVARINAELQKAGLTHARAEQVGNEIFLEGHVEDEADARKAQLIAESFTGGPVPNMP